MNLMLNQLTVFLTKIKVESSTQYIQDNIYAKIYSHQVIQKN